MKEYICNNHHSILIFWQQMGCGMVKHSTVALLVDTSKIKIPICQYYKTFIN